MTTFFPWRAALVTLTLLVSTPARADATDTAAAIAAFDEAGLLMQSGKVEAACTKYQESYTLDPQLGTLLHLGYYQEQTGLLASAWSAFRDAADWAKRIGDKRTALAEERARLLEPRLSRLKLTLPLDLPATATVRRNGKLIPQSVLRSAFPLDRGHYEITVSAPGYEAWTGRVELTQEGQVVNLHVPKLHEKPKPAPGGSGASLQGSSETSLIARKWPAFVAGGVAMVGGVVWGVFGIQSIQAKADAQDATGQTQRELLQLAYDRGTVATVGMIVTGVGIATSITLFAVLPGKEPRARVGASPPALRANVGLTQVQLEGSF